MESEEAEAAAGKVVVAALAARRVQETTEEATELAGARARVESVCSGAAAVGRAAALAAARQQLATATTEADAQAQTKEVSFLTSPTTTKTQPLEGVVSSLGPTQAGLTPESALHGGSAAGCALCGAALAATPRLGAARAALAERLAVHKAVLQAATEGVVAGAKAHFAAGGELYAPRRVLDVVAEAGEAPGAALHGGARPPDMGRLTWEQEEVVIATGVFLRAEEVRLGAATAAQLYGWQRSFLRSLVSLEVMEQLTLTIILESCAAADKVDAMGSPVPFARELASYLAHCVRQGRLVGAAAGEDGQFAGFFRVLNDVLAVRERAERSPRVAGLDDGAADGLTFDGDTGVAGGGGYRLLERLGGGGPHAC